MFPALKNNAAAGYKGPVKIELLEGTCLLNNVSWTRFAHDRVITGVQTITSVESLLVSTLIDICHSCGLSSSKLQKFPFPLIDHLESPRDFLSIPSEKFPIVLHFQPINNIHQTVH